VFPSHRTIEGETKPVAVESMIVSGEAMDEGRRAPRHRVLKAGTITFGGGAGISCTIRNLSDTGAALEVISPIGIPQEFVLVVDADNSTRQCRVVWRKERRIGVTFVS
jgi:hypothetical protein